MSELVRTTLGRSGECQGIQTCIQLCLVIKRKNAATNTAEAEYRDAVNHLGLECTDHIRHMKVASVSD